MRAFLLLLAAGNVLAQGPDEPRLAEPSPSPEVSPSPLPERVVTPAPPAPLGPAPMLAAPFVVEEAHTATWPWTLDLHVLVGAELHGQGQPIAFGLGAEALWHGWIGIFASLFGSEGTPILVGPGMPSLADRVSVPLGFAVRPAGREAAKHDGWGWRLLGGIGLQAGLSIEHLRVTDSGVTTAGLHLGLGVDVPLYGGPLVGGVALRAGARLIVTPEVRLDASTANIQEPVASGQLFVGIAYVP